MGFWSGSLSKFSVHGFNLLGTKCLHLKACMKTIFTKMEVCGNNMEKENLRTELYSHPEHSTPSRLDLSFPTTATGCGKAFGNWRKSMTLAFHPYLPNWIIWAFKWIRWLLTDVPNPSICQGREGNFKCLQQTISQFTIMDMWRLLTPFSIHVMNNYTYNADEMSQSGWWTKHMRQKHVLPHFRSSVPNTKFRKKTKLWLRTDTQPVTGSSLWPVEASRFNSGLNSAGNKSFPDSYNSTSCLEWDHSLSGALALQCIT